MSLTGRVVGEGFEPSKAMPTDLQSVPFGHSGTPPQGNHSLHDTDRPPAEAGLELAKGLEPATC